MADCCIIPVSIDECECTFDASLSINNEIELDLGINPTPVYPDIYEGSYEIIPTGERQILKTNGLMMNGNVVIEKIPDNYGMITWNGSFLRVS